MKKQFNIGDIVSTYTWGDLKVISITNNEKLGVLYTLNRGSLYFDKIPHKELISSIKKTIKEIDNEIDYLLNKANELKITYNKVANQLEDYKKYPLLVTF